MSKLRGFYGLSPALLERVGSPAAAALWDTLHPYRLGESPAEVLAAIGPYLAHVHLKDGWRPAPGGTDWPLVTLGEGDVPLRAIIAALHDHGYAGALSFEWEKKWHPHLAGPEVVLPAARAWLHSVAPPAVFGNGGRSEGVGWLVLGSARIQTTG